MNKEQLQKQIKEQEERNINLFNIFQYRLHEEEMQPLIQEWREGSNKLKTLNNKLDNLEIEERVEKLINEDNKKEIKILIQAWINGNEYFTTVVSKLNSLEIKEKGNNITPKTFVNGYGEATKRYITSSTYERAERSRLKAVASFMGNR